MLLLSRLQAHALATLCQTLESDGQTSPDGSSVSGRGVGTEDGTPALDPLQASEHHNQLVRLLSRQGTDMRIDCEHANCTLRKLQSWPMLPSGGAACDLALDLLAACMPHMLSSDCGTDWQL